MTQLTQQFRSKPGFKATVRLLVLMLVVGLPAIAAFSSSNHLTLTPESQNFGPRPCSTMVGDPIDAVSGNHYYAVTDVELSSDFGTTLQFHRSYNSGGGLLDGGSGLGPNWTHTLSEHVREDSLGWITLVEGTGRHVYFRNFQSPSDIPYRLERDVEIEGYTVIKNNNTVCKFRNDGRLVAINDRDYPRIRIEYEGDRMVRASDVSGRALIFDWNSINRIQGISLADGSIWCTFEYDEFGLLAGVTYADGSGEYYDYKVKQAPTGLMTKRCTSDGVCWFYDYDFSRRAVLNHGNDSVHLVTMNYTVTTRSYEPTLYRTTVMNEDTTIFESVRAGSRRKLIKRQRISSAKPDIELSYDAGGNKISEKYGSNTPDSIGYDSLGREVFRRMSRAGADITQASMQAYLPSRFTLTDAIQMAGPRPNDETYIDLGYDDHGNVIAINEYDVRQQTLKPVKVTTLLYNDLGQVLSVDGPEPGATDAMFAEYYDNGDIRKVVGPEGFAVEYGPKDKLGNPLWVRSHDGSELRFSYDARGRLISVREVLPGGDELTTTCAYNYASDVTSVEYSDGTLTTYRYDNHGWLVEIVDSEAGRAKFTYDSYGHITDHLSITRQGDTLRTTAMESY